MGSVFFAKYYSKGSLIKHYKSSSIWPGIKEGLNLLLPDTCYLLGYYSDCSFWNDLWLEGEKTTDIVVVPQQWRLVENYTIKDMRQHGRWKLPEFLKLQYPNVEQKIQQVEVAEMEDNLSQWKGGTNGELSMKQAFDHYREKSIQQLWMKKLWSIFIPPKISLLVWKIIRRRLPTADRLVKSGM